MKHSDPYASFGLARPVGTQKQRDILFSRFPPGQVTAAAGLLSGLEGLQAYELEHRRTVAVAYNLLDYTLRGLETGLEQQGFHLDNSLMSKLTRALVYYVEETQLRNLRAPQRLIKTTSHEGYAQAWEHHLHGDHDDTPPEWRNYK